MHFYDMPTTLIMIAYFYCEFMRLFSFQPLGSYWMEKTTVESYFVRLIEVI